MTYFVSIDVCYISTINGGVYCPICAGIHRELGTHPDFVTLTNDIHIRHEDMQVILHYLFLFLTFS